MVLVIRAIYTCILYLARFFPSFVTGLSTWFFKHKFFASMLMMVLVPIMNFFIGIRLGGFVS